MKAVLSGALAVLAGAAFAVGIEGIRTRALDGEWKFLRDDGEKVSASAADFDDSAWQRVIVPHDWAIAGPFDPREGGWQGKLPWRGAGWYRRTFDLTADEAKSFAARARIAYLEFDGVMARPEVFVNGAKVGGWDYGYMSFTLDVTRFLQAGRNTLAVKASTKTHESRWYPGAGLYRSVRFVSRPKNHVLPGTLAITTLVKGLKLTDGRPSAESATVNVAYESSAEGKKTASFEVKNPRLWDLGKGELYTLELLGETFTYGIRDFRFDAREGFILNGRRVQLNGVDLHSDMGPLGMAFDRDVMKRQLLIMKDMGVNALRTSHNAPDPYVLDLCDEFGFFVWNECFDKWDNLSGRRDDENLEAYVSRNLRQFVRRDRNHPSVFCWSIGNEISPIEHCGKPTGMTNARFTCFRNAIRAFDTTRPVAIGCCNGLGPLVDFNLLDLVGWNYGAGYRAVRKQYPNLPVLYSESASAVSEYGFYEQPPALTKTAYARDTLQVGSYDHNAAPWSDIPDVEFARMAVDRYCCGEFVWTGIDYLGEPTPIVPGDQFGITNANEQCARSSYFGAVDLCGIPKDRFYIYRSHWNRDSETVHILPHWNWSQPSTPNSQPPTPNSQPSTPNSQLSTRIPVYVYTSGDEAELFLNGRSLGRRKKGPAPARVNLAAGAKATASSEERIGDNYGSYYDVCHQYRLRWFDVQYEPGELKAVAYRSGRKIGEQAMRTAGKAVAVKLTDDPFNPPEAKTRFVQVDVVDAKGVRDPLSMADVRFSLTGPGEIVAVGNGNPKDHKSFKDVTHHPLQYGKAVAVVRRRGPGPIALKASVDGMKDGVLILDESVTAAGIACP